MQKRQNRFNNGISFNLPTRRPIITNIINTLFSPSPTINTFATVSSTQVILEPVFSSAPQVTNQLVIETTPLSDLSTANTIFSSTTSSLSITTTTSLQQTSTKSDSIIQSNVSNNQQSTSTSNLNPIFILLPIIFVLILIMGFVFFLKKIKLKLKSKKNNQDNFFINNTTTSFKVLVSNQVGYDPEFVEPKFNTLDNKGFLSQSRPNVSNATPANRNEETEIVVTGKPMVEEERLLFNNTETATLEPKETLYNLQVQTTNPNIPIRGSSQQPLPEVNKFKKLKNPTLQNLIVNDLHQNHTLSPPTVTTPLTATIDEIANPRDSTFFKNIYN